MTPAERDELVEAAVSAHRDRSRDGSIRPSPAWADLPADDREAVYGIQTAIRRVEAAIDVQGRNATVRSVERLIEGLEQF